MLGTRPNDTLRPLELLKPCEPYRLRNLIRADFDLILQHRSVTLARTLADQFYRALNENALFLDLVAKELAKRGNLVPSQVEEIIRKIADDPDNLFFLAVERLKYPDAAWEHVLKPLLGLLLTAREPLDLLHLKQLLNAQGRGFVDGEHLKRGLERLSDFIAVDEQYRYTLFHLKLYDFLRQDPKRPTKAYFFDREDEQRWHQRFIVWCEQRALADIWQESKDTAEQVRRRYARQHYITHLYHAHAWDKLFAVLDEGEYGSAKIQDDPSMRSYALDLDWGREAASPATWELQEAIHLLPRLWNYTLLRCSLASRADNYPVEAFVLMLLLGEEAKALGLAELITLPERKAEVWLLMARHMAQQPERAHEAERLWQEAERVIGSITDERSQAEALRELASALAQAQRWQEAEHLWQEAERVIGSIRSEGDRAVALRELASPLAQAQRWQEAERVIGFITDEEHRAEALSRLADTLMGYHQDEHVMSLVHSWWRQAKARDEALQLLVLARGLIQHYPELGMAFYNAFAWVDNFLRGDAMVVRKMNATERKDD